MSYFSKLKKHAEISEELSQIPGYYGFYSIGEEAHEACKKLKSQDKYDPFLMPALVGASTSLLAIWLGLEISEKISNYYNIHNGFSELFLDSVSLIGSGITGFLSGVGLTMHLESKLIDAYARKYRDTIRNKKMEK